MIKLYSAALSALFLCACASNPGVVPMGGNSFHVAREAATGFSGTTALKADALREADAYCTKKGQSMAVTSTKESKPPYLFGNYPRAEVEFRCQ